jgi:plastocyanin
MDVGTRTSRSIKRVALALSAVAMLILVPATSAQALVRVSATASHTFEPRRVHVTRGTRVVWKSLSGTHTVTAYSSNWSKNTTINTGQTTSFRFRRRGVFLYRCLIHSTLVNGVCSGMCGRVRVG